MVAITTISSRTRAMTIFNFRRFSTQMHLYKAFFLLHTSVVNTFEFKEILCFHSLNCIGVQIAFRPLLLVYLNLTILWVITIPYVLKKAIVILLHSKDN